MSIENRKVFYGENDAEDLLSLHRQLHRVTVTNLLDEGKNLTAEGTLVFYDRFTNTSFVTRWTGQGSYRGVFQWFVKSDGVQEETLDLDSRYAVAITLTDVVKTVRMNPRKGLSVIVESSISA